MADRVEYKGARFYKCALQVNPYNYSSNYQGGKTYDEADYNSQILNECLENNIEVVGLADHGSVEHSKGLQNYLKQNNITVFPGFEIASSEKIHMVCLYDESKTGSELNQFLGQLMGENISKLQENPKHPSSKSCQEIARIILEEQGGFWYAAHATHNNGLLRLSGSGDNLVSLWRKEDIVLAVQIPGKIEDMDVEQGDLRKYKEIIENKNLDYKREKSIAIINAKDVNIPNKLSEPSASCLIKMTNPTFDAFKSAFKDPQSRIQFNHSTPENPISAIKSIHWQGAGLFGNQKLAFSPNLNAVIGGRGTGKSTLIESIRFVLDMLPRGEDNKRVVQEIRKRNLDNAQVKMCVSCASQQGAHYTISRRYGGAPIVTNEDGEISHMSPKDLLPEVELLGQNEILDIEKSNMAKSAIIDRFIPNAHKFSENIEKIRGWHR